MISSIHIDNAATYSNITIEPKQINFVYGGNGTGKTTLSRVISGTSSGSYHIEWENGTNLETLVFNGEFIEKNFSERISGIFTLGEDDDKTARRIEELGKDIDDLGNEITTKSKSVTGQREKQKEAFQQFAEACWIQRKTFSRFSEILKGTLKGKDTFAKSCLAKAAEVAADGSPQIEDLFDEYARVYSNNLQKQERIELSELNEIAVPEACNLLTEPITGSGNTPIGAFIDYLQSSNWVKQGVELYPLAKGRCPYCQRTLPAELETEIEAYFDDRYEESVRAIRSYQATYASFRDRVIQSIEAIEESVPNEYDVNEVDAAAEALNHVLDVNLSAIKQKLVDPSSKVEMSDETEALTAVKAAFGRIDKQIAANNELCDNISSTRSDLSRRVWGLILHNLSSAQKAYSRSAGGCEKAINSIQAIITNKEDEKRKKQAEKAHLETTRTSITPTVDAINSLLERFGFTGFSLSEDKQSKGMYRIVRPDGADARRTLSEGEYNLISFLYFYHLVYGSLETDGIDTPRVVVIDDPISSLDSNVMFIITSLAKEIVKDCRDGKHGIKQVFILTHNVYFHKEVTFLGSRSKWPETKCAYWIISKADERTAISHHADNPISTSYELLWDEIRDIGDAPNKNAFNTMRRILEYYFSVIGGIDYEECIDMFDGADKITCKALVSCINEGSHMISDDFVIVFTPEAMKSYRRVFKEIFYKLGQRAHYEMMMEENTSLPMQA